MQFSAYLIPNILFLLATAKNRIKNEFGKEKFSFDDFVLTDRHDSMSAIQCNFEAFTLEHVLN